MVDNKMEDMKVVNNKVVNSKVVDSKVVNRKSDIDWIYSKAVAAEDVYLVGDLIAFKEYSVEDVHRWAASGELGEDGMRVYRKLKDLLEGRIWKGINDGSVNQQLGLKALGEFFERRVEVEDAGGVVSACRERLDEMLARAAGKGAVGKGGSRAKKSK
jgi:hypothetical protein